MALFMMKDQKVTNKVATNWRKAKEAQAQASASK